MGMTKYVSGRSFARSPAAVWGAAAIAIIILTATWSRAADVSTSNPERSLYGLIRTTVDSPKLDRNVIEQLFGVRLSLVSSDYFDRYEAHAVKLNEGVVELIDYREPSSVGGASAGPILVMKIGGNCIKKSDIFSRYMLSEISNVPHGHSLDEETVFLIREPWGGLSFGFSERSPDCLRTVGISVTSPRGK